MTGRYEVKASDRFWLTLKPLRAKYSREQILEIIAIVKDAIDEPAPPVEACGDSFAQLGSSAIQ